MNIGEIVKRYREATGLTMGAFAQKSGLTKGYISMLENNKNSSTGKPISPSLEKIKQIADAMQITVDDILKMMDDDEEITLDFETKIAKNPQFRTVAAHFDGDMTKDEMDKIINFVEFVKSQRK